MICKLLFFLVQEFSRAGVGWQVEEGEDCEEEGERSFNKEEVLPRIEVRVLDSEDTEG